MSLLYLLFLVLAITQVSNAWMPLTGWIGNELRSEQESINLNSQGVYDVISSDSFQSVRQRLIELRETDGRSEGLVQRYVIEGQLGQDFQKEIVRLYSELPKGVQLQLKEGILSDDFANDIQTVNEPEWLNWKFKNLTPSLAEIVFEQMTLAILNVAEANEASSMISPTRRWDINDSEGYRYVGDSLLLYFPGGSVQWTKNGEPVNLDTGSYYILGNKDLGLWTYTIVSDDSENQAKGEIEIRTKPKRLVQKNIENTAFWLPGDTIKVFNSLWRSVKVSSDIGEVTSTGDGLFLIQFNTPGIHKYEVTLTTGVSISKEAVVNDFPVPELRKSFRLADLAISEKECIQIIPDDTESNYKVISMDGVIVNRDSHSSFKTSDNCLTLKDQDKSPVAIHFNKIILEFRGNEIVMNHHTMKVL